MYPGSDVAYCVVAVRYDSSLGSNGLMHVLKFIQTYVVVCITAVPPVHMDAQLSVVLGPCAKKASEGGFFWVYLPRF